MDMMEGEESCEGNSSHWPIVCINSVRIVWYTRAPHRQEKRYPLSSRETTWTETAVGDRECAVPAVH